jgi:hypothetical protein
MPRTYSVEIQEIVVTRNGTSVYVNRNARKVWPVIPGVAIKKNQRSFRKLFFPCQYDTQKILSMIRSLPISDPKKFYLSEESDPYISYTASYRRKGYNPASNQVNPLPKAITPLKEILNSMTIYDVNRM